MTIENTDSQRTGVDFVSVAVEVAARQHRFQTDKAGEPYILHPMRVMLLARERGLPLAMQAAAVLHDVVEDTDYTEGHLRGAFPAAVADAVMHLTRRKPQGETYDQFIDRICEAPSDVIELKLCDLDDNMSPARATTDKLRALVWKRYRPTREKLTRVLERRYGV